MSDLQHSFSDATHVQSMEGEKSPMMLMSPLSPNEGKSDFLAAYGLELDEDDDEDEESSDDLESPRTPGSSPPVILSKIQKSRSKMMKKQQLFLNKALASSPNGSLRRTSDASMSPSSSPRAHPRRMTLVNLVRNKSPTSNSPDLGYKTAGSLLSSPSPRSLIDYSGRGIDRESFSPPHSSRRGFLETNEDLLEEQSIIDDASSVSLYPESTLAHLETKMQSNPSDSGASSHTQVTDEGIFDEEKVMEPRTDDSASSLNDEESYENAKVGGQPISLPARTISTPLEERVDSTPVVIASAPALPPRRSVSKPAEAKTREEVKQAKAEEKEAIESEKIIKEKLESMAKKEEIDTKILMKSYEELEVERFLADFGKHVRQVRSTGFIDTSTNTSHAWPQREEWRHAETGKLNTAGFTFAYILSIFAYLSPTRFMDLQAEPSTPMPEDLSEFIPEEQFRIAALRANAERLYLTALPMYEGLFDRARKIWRWENLFKTSIWCSSYFICWYRGMLLPALFGLIIWTVLMVRSFPPQPQELREMLVKQQKRTRELQQAKKAKAEDIIRQAQEDPDMDRKDVKNLKMKKKGKYGLAADATRRYGKVATMITSALADVHERIKNFIMWRSVPATWRAITLLFIGMIVTFFSTPWMIARFPGLMLGVSFFIIAPIVEHRPEWMGVEWTNPFDFLLAGVPNDAQHAMQVLRKRAAAGEALTGDIDVIRWIKGIDEEDEDTAEEVDGRDAALLPVMPTLEGAPGVEAVSTAVDSVKAKGSSTIDWKKWRATMNRGREMAVAGSEMLSGQRQLELPRIGAPTQDTVSMRMIAGMSKGINWGIDSLQNSSNRKLNARILDTNEEISASDGVYWAVHLGSCGHVVVTSDRIRFRSFFARKMKVESDNLNTESENNEEVPVLDAVTGKVLVDEKQMQEVSVRTLLDIRLESIIALKKTRTVNVPGVWGIDGLEVRSRGGKVHHFSSIVKRDEAFNRILALAPQNWSKQ